MKNGNKEQPRLRQPTTPSSDERLLGRSGHPDPEEAKNADSV